MPWVSTPGAAFTWNSAGFTWNDADAGKTWNTASPFSHVGTFDEPINFAEVKNASPTKVFPEAFAIAEAGARNPGKRVNEPLNFAELFASLSAFNPVFAESVAFLEAEFENYGLNKAEAWATVEAEWENFNLNKAEAVSFAEVMNRTLAWQRIYPENFLFSDFATKNFTKQLAETFNVFDTFVRQGPAVLSNMQLRQDEITFAQFMIEVANNVPAGYGPFQPFVAGDYDISKALIKITMRRENVQQNLRLLSGKVFMDVADVTDRGSITISSTAAPVYIPFTRKFLIPPEVTVVMVGAAGFAMPRISGTTKTGFNIELVNNVGTRVTGTASWQAEGY